MTATVSLGFIDSFFLVGLMLDSFPLPVPVPVFFNLLAFVGDTPVVEAFGGFVAFISSVGMIGATFLISCYPQ